MKSITPAEAHAAADAFILDVREDEERARARVDGTHHIPLAALVERLDEIPLDRTVYVMCAVGGRSARATPYLESQGIDAVNIDGGIAEWHRVGLPVTVGGTA